MDKASSHCSLQGFCDASSGAYAAVVYLRIESSAGSMVNFVASKTRVVPTSKQSIPRLELLSTLLLAKLINSITVALEPEVQLQEHSCFTNSKIALYLIKGTTKEWKPFVENRVNEVRKFVPAECWRHCPEKENPTDVPSRGITPAELVSCKLWHHGPEWLVHKLNKEEDVSEMPEECQKEIKISCHPTYNLVVTNNSKGLSTVVHCENFSRLQRLLRVTAYMLRSIDTLKGRIKKINVAQIPELTAAEVGRAEKLWIIESQKCVMEDQNFPTWQRQFGLFLDEGVWRCKGILGNADIPYSARHPALLHKCHHLTLLIIRDAH